MSRPLSAADAIVSDRTRTPDMFNSIAGRYDLLNRVLSLGIDRRWRRAMVTFARVRDGAAVLDVATGTGDVALEFARRTGAGAIVGVDMSAGMLDVAGAKLPAASGRAVDLVQGDALSLPFADATFDAVAIAFGLRNLPDYGAGVAEMVRVLRPGGRLVVLEFLPPRGTTLLAYRAYLGTFLPVVGRLLSGSNHAYRYLASSIRGFLEESRVRALLANAGLQRVESRRFTAGIAALYRGAKS
jgi:demethylmenaquinone methyltransferase / 2-methoxy-6-polyprenyl-1,4-benzoquinol methylase